MELFVGIDLGTSGCRAAAIDAAGALCAEAAVSLPEPQRRGPGSRQQPAAWWQAVRAVLARLARQIAPERVRALAVDGTSASLLLAAADGRPLTPALMYDDASSSAEAQRIGAVAPGDCAAHGPTSALAKLLQLRQSVTGPVRYALHQTDWVSGFLTGRFGISDENNCLKLGYDVVRREWPAWLDELNVDRALLPRVLIPGTAIGPLQHPDILALGFTSHTRVVAGTTDGVASFLATGAHAPGDAVTSLGSTLTVKVLSRTPLFAPEYGIYSHRLDRLWLAGGASNSGGAVLLKYFKREQLEALSAQLAPDRPTGLDYYPLAGPGERFPVCDPGLEPRLEPRPADDAVFFQGLLEGIAAIEAQGYRRLAELGAPYPASVQTVGGGARNRGWTRIRQDLLGVPVTAASHDQTCYGTALLARRAALD